MWALFAVYQAICKIIGIGAAAACIPRTRSASRMPWPPRRIPSRLPPEQADLALATFLLKILTPATFTRIALTGLASTVDQLAKLADLRDRGVITATEFDREKAKILA